MPDAGSRRGVGLRPRQSYANMGVGNRPRLPSAAILATGRGQQAVLSRHLVILHLESNRKLATHYRQHHRYH